MRRGAVLWWSSKVSFLGEGDSVLCEGAFEVLQDGVGHFGGTDEFGSFGAFLVDVACAQAIVQGSVHSGAYRVCQVIALGGGLEQHRCRQDGGDGVGFVLAGNVGCGAVHGLVDGCAFAQRGGGEHSQGAGEGCGEVREDIAEHVSGDDNLCVLWTCHKVHGVCVDVVVLELYIRVLAFVQVDDGIAPHAHDFEHVGFVDAGEFRLTVTRKFESNACDALHFFFGVAHGVEAFGAVFFDAAWLAKVDAAVEFTHDDEVRACGELWAQRTCTIKAAVELGGAQVCEHAHLFADFQKTALRAEFWSDVVPFGAAACAHEHSVRRDGLLDDFVCDGDVMDVERCATKEGVFEIPLDSGFLAHRLEHAACGVVDLGTDSITIKYENIHNRGNPAYLGEIDAAHAARCSN